MDDEVADAEEEEEDAEDDEEQQPPAGVGGAAAVTMRLEHDCRTLHVFFWTQAGTKARHSAALPMAPPGRQGVTEPLPTEAKCL